MRTINAIPVSIQYFGRRNPLHVRVQVYIFVYFPLHTALSSDICNGLLRVCAYVARRNALDNCYYLKLHLPPLSFFFTNFAINIRTMALLYADWNIYRRPMIFLCKNMCNGSPRKISSKWPCAHIDRGLRASGIKLSDAATCRITRIDFLVHSSKSLDFGRAVATVQIYRGYYTANKRRANGKPRG